MTDSIPPAEAGTDFDDVPGPSTLRHPVSPDAPTGADLAADGTCQAIDVARAAVRTSADWGAVRSRCAEALARGRDPWVAARLTEALVHQHGIAGLRSGLRALEAVMAVPGADPAGAHTAAALLAATLPPVLDRIPPDGGGDTTWLDAVETDLTEALAAVEGVDQRLAEAGSEPRPDLTPLTTRLNQRLQAVRDDLVTATLGAAQRATGEALTDPPAGDTAAHGDHPGRARARHLLEEAAALLEAHDPAHPAGPLARRAARWAGEASGPLVARLLADGAARDAIDPVRKPG